MKWMLFYTMHTYTYITHAHTHTHTLRCGSGLQGLKDQGYTNSVVCRLIQNYEDIFEVCCHSPITIYGEATPLPPIKQQPSSGASPVGPGMTSPANTSSEGGQDKMEDSPPLTDPSGSHTPTSGHTVAKYHQRSALSVPNDLAIPKVHGGPNDLAIPKVHGGPNDLAIPKVHGGPNDLAIPKVHGGPNDLAIPKVHGGKGPKVKSTTGTAVATPLDPHEHDSRVTPIATSSNAAGNDGSRSPFVASMKTDGHSDSTVPTTTNGYVRVKAVVHGHRVQEDTKEAGAEEEVDGPVANISEARKDGRLLVGSKWADLSSTYPTPAVMSSANIDRLSTTSGAGGQQSPHRQARGRPVHHAARDTQHTEDVDVHRDTSAPDHHSRKRGGAQSSENSPSRSGEIKMDATYGATTDTMTGTRGREGGGGEGGKGEGKERGREGRWEGEGGKVGGGGREGGRGREGRWEGEGGKVGGGGREGEGGKVGGKVGGRGREGGKASCGGQVQV